MLRYVLTNRIIGKSTRHTSSIALNKQRFHGNIWARRRCSDSAAFMSWTLLGRDKDRHSRANKLAAGMGYVIIEVLK